MPFALLIVGVVLLIAGVRNSQDALFATVKGDFTGSNNFLYWFAAIIIIGSIGYVPKLKPLSTAFLGLIIVALFLSKGGFFDKFSTALQGTAAGSLMQSPTSTTQTTPTLQGLQTQVQNLQQGLLGKLAPYLQGPSAGQTF